jgi:hypothetical protein
MWITSFWENFDLNSLSRKSLYKANFVPEIWVKVGRFFKDIERFWYGVNFFGYFFWVYCFFEELLF